MLWELEYGEDRRTFEAWGLSDLTREDASLGTDVVRFSGPTAVDVAPLFEHRAILVIYRDGVRWFEGALELAPGVGRGASESRNYEVHGGWAYLERLTFQQDWKADTTGEGELGNVKQSRVIINQNQDNSPQTTAQVITEVVNYAIAAGYAISLGTVDVDLQQLTDELTDPKCAEVIRRVLRLQPDVVSWLDYSPNPPALNFARTATATEKVVAVSDNVRGVTCTARPDLQVPAVIIKYESESQVDDETFRTVVEDKYPAEATGTEDGAIVTTVALDGGSITREKVTLVRRSLPTAYNSLNVIPWWRRHIPWFNEIFNAANGAVVTIPDTHLSIPPGGHTITLTNPDEVAEGVLASDMTHELVEGTITDWMEEGSFHVKAAEVTVRVRMHYTGPSLAVQAVFDYDPASGVYYRDEAIQLMATNATKNIYTRVVSSTPGEEIPTGLAQKIYTSLRALTHEGSFTLVDTDVPSGWNVGQRVTFTGVGAGIIQSLSYDIAGGALGVKFGPPAHRTLNQILEAIRANRDRTTTQSSGSRKSGKKTDQGTVIQAAQKVPAVSGGPVPRPGANPALHPFRVLVRPKSGGGWEAGVVYQSSLYLSLRPDHNTAITGLLSEDLTTGWFDVEMPDAVWLGIVFDSGGTITTAEIASWGEEGEFDVEAEAWSGTNAYVEDDGGDPPIFQTARKLIARIIEGSDGTPIVKQSMFTHQLLRDVSIDGQAAKYPFSHEGGYVL